METEFDTESVTEIKSKTDIRHQIPEPKPKPKLRPIKNGEIFPLAGETKAVTILTDSVCKTCRLILARRFLFLFMVAAVFQFPNVLNYSKVLCHAKTTHVFEKDKAQLLRLKHNLIEATIIALTGTKRDGGDGGTGRDYEAYGKMTPMH